MGGAARVEDLTFVWHADVRPVAHGARRENLISFEEALAQSTNPDDFALKARGISSTSDARWEDFDKDGSDGEEPIKVDRF